MMRRFRRHGTGLLVVFAIASAIAVHHSGLAMGDMHHDMGLGVAMELCLGVFVAVGAAVVAVAIALVAIGRWRPLTDLRAVGLSFAIARPQPRARAGPALLSLLCISRR